MGRTSDTGERRQGGCDRAENGSSNEEQIDLNRDRTALIQTGLAWISLIARGISQHV